MVPEAAHTSPAPLLLTLQNHQKAKSKCGWTLRSLWLLVFIVFPHQLLASSDESGPLAADQVLKALHATMVSALKRDAHQIEENPRHLVALANEILGPHVDFIKMSKLILGKHWRSMKEVQRKRFIVAFKTKVGQAMIKMYKPDFTYELDIMGAQLNKKKNKTLIKTIVTENGSATRYRVNYRAHLAKKQWRVYDVAVDGVSVLQSFKSASASEIERSGVEALILQMEEGLDPALKASFAGLNR